MTTFLGILPDISPIILDSAFDSCVESVEEWKSCLVILSVNRLWRHIGIPKLYKHAIIQYPRRNGMQNYSTNIDLIITNGNRPLVRNFILCTTSPIPTLHGLGIIYKWLKDDLTYIMNSAQLSTSLTHIGIEAPPSIVGAIIEQLLRNLPNLRFLLIRDMNSLFGGLFPKLLCYLVTGYPDIVRPPDAYQAYVVVHNFARLMLNAPITETTLNRMSPRFFKRLEKAPVPYERLRDMRSQVNMAHGISAVFAQYMLYYPNLLFRNSSGEVTWYELYMLLDNEMMGYERNTPPS
ncbi:hypothetical protein COEREDRAFT_87678 [Coemansia reversa NRRL 1564]|uniref:Uncharacterized protein n=1 Tax=Coemansia reversa (strain ATCC 12441 / NRRL 1564) TaxID=763665 RepID=A0A2G5B9Q8_COERN|nr:hypothetical protein COEREDRAFT_87678 [Coemansia reversa NRRL 1564]|eukprot:PIA15720.1 hypothetical protein COEREDRAFT_87678 [Coemansia reversa NRRL 1564]